jgi:hypothetical protein
MRSAALNQKNVMSVKVTPEGIARGNVSAELEPDGNARLNKLRARREPVRWVGWNAVAFANQRYCIDRSAY